jgi:hypothetical protein
MTKAGRIGISWKAQQMRLPCPFAHRSRGSSIQPDTEERWFLSGCYRNPDLFDGNGEVRDFDLVVRRKGLTVAQLLGAGIPEAIARRAVGPGPMGE